MPAFPDEDPFVKKEKTEKKNKPLLFFGNFTFT
jgi:hypothetical protein